MKATRKKYIAKSLRQSLRLRMITSTHLTGQKRDVASEKIISSGDRNCRLRRAPVWTSSLERFLQPSYDQSKTSSPTLKPVSRKNRLPTDAHGYQLQCSDPGSHTPANDSGGRSPNMAWSGSDEVPERLAAYGDRKLFKTDGIAGRCTTKGDDDKPMFD